MIKTPLGTVEIVNEPNYEFDSSAKPWKYPAEFDLDPEHRSSSVHGVLLDGAPLAVFGNAGGASGVHAQSAVHVAGPIYLAVGDSVVCFTLRPFKLEWILQVDEATCFGVYYQPRHDALIAHGELAVTRFSPTGKVVWRAGGADILTEGFLLGPHQVEVVDFKHQRYRFAYVDGRPPLPGFWIPMLNLLRWLAIVPGSLVAWYAAIFIGLFLLTTVEGFCPGAVVGSGQCTASWYPSAERATICIGAALAAFLVVAAASVIAPGRRILVSRIALGVGAAVACFIAVRTHAYLALASALVSGYLATLAVAGYERRKLLDAPNGNSSAVVGLGLFAAAAFGILTQYPHPFAMPDSVSWSFALLTAALTYAWFRLDAAEIAYRPPVWLHVLVVGLGQLALPVYFARSREWRTGLLAFLKQLAFLTCVIAVGVICAMAVTAHRIDVFGDLWNWATLESRWH